MHWLAEAGRAALGPARVSLATPSADLARNPDLALVLGARPALATARLGPRADAYVGWGRRPSGLRAQALAQRHSADFLLLEDGFLRSVGRAGACVSYLLDRRGVHYDARHPSDMEAAIARPLGPDEHARAQQLAEAWRSGAVSKYNGAPEFDGDLSTPYVLVIDQTQGDASIPHGLADAASFERMLAAALAEYPDHQVIVKTHPDVATRGRRGHFDGLSMANPRLRRIDAPVHPVRLIRGAAAVYTVTSQLGFEALIWGKRVRCFGMPFYAGWGLTEDALPSPPRRRAAAAVTAEQVIHAALVDQARYIDPVTQTITPTEAAIALIALQRRCRAAFRAPVHLVGMARWKRRFLRAFLQGADPQFRAPPAGLGTGSVAVWGDAPAPPCPPGVALLRIEDGFLRSAGLGADLVAPLSLAIDDIGLHYDAARPSRLEQILQHGTLDAAARARAAALRQQIVALDLTKYNLRPDTGHQGWRRPAGKADVLLVVGQVDSDASLRHGAPEIASNAALLRRVRAENPTAHIVYKPHPDVLAGLRRSGRAEERARAIADNVLTQPMALGDLLAQVDAVHTMTSLLGFEAVLRGARVICHGLPFYAGWGLTEDRQPCPRRTRRLDLDALVHGALIAYPRYLDPDSGFFIEPEQAVARLAKLAQADRPRQLSGRIRRGALVAALRLTGRLR